MNFFWFFSLIGLFLILIDSGGGWPVPQGYDVEMTSSACWDLLLSDQ